MEVPFPSLSETLISSKGENESVRERERGRIERSERGTGEGGREREKQEEGDEEGGREGGREGGEGEGGR